MDKYCKKCDTTKPVSEFGKNASRKDGLNAYCRECHNRAVKEWKEKNPDYQKEWKEKNPDYQKKWREKNPDYSKEWYEENKEARSEYYVMNKEQYKKNGIAWREKNPDKLKEWKENNPDYQIQYKYGLSQADYNKLLEDQNYACAICGGDNNGKTLVVDHDHSCCKGKKSCGKCVRQLLCSRCNLMLGHAKDDPEILKKAANYLERHSKAKILAKKLEI